MRTVIKQKTDGSVKMARISQGMSQHQLGKAAGVCHASVCAAENGKPVSTNTAHKLSETLGKEFNALFDVIIS